MGEPPPAYPLETVPFDLRYKEIENRRWPGRSTEVRLAGAVLLVVLSILIFGFTWFVSRALLMGCSGFLALPVSLLRLARATDWLVFDAFSCRFSLLTCITALGVWGKLLELYTNCDLHREELFTKFWGLDICWGVKIWAVGDRLDSSCLILLVLLWVLVQAAVLCCIVVAGGCQFTRSAGIPGALCQFVYSCWCRFIRLVMGAWSKASLISWKPIHVREIWARFWCIKGNRIFDEGSGCRAIIVPASKVRGPHSLECGLYV